MGAPTSPSETTQTKGPRRDGYIGRIGNQTVSKRTRERWRKDSLAKEEREVLQLREDGALRKRVPKPQTSQWGKEGKTTFRKISKKGKYGPESAVT
jgi:hypothetical protein